MAQDETILVLVNGSLTKEFAMSKGLRQDDPFSPFLFLIMAEGLNSIVRTIMGLNLSKEAPISRMEYHVSHL